MVSLFAPPPPAKKKKNGTLIKRTLNLNATLLYRTTHIKMPHVSQRPGRCESWQSSISRAMRRSGGRMRTLGFRV